MDGRTTCQVGKERGHLSALPSPTHCAICLPLTRPWNRLRPGRKGEVPGLALLCSEVSHRLNPWEVCKSLKSSYQASQGDVPSPTWHWPLGGTCSPHIPRSTWNRPELLEGGLRRCCQLGLGPQLPEGHTCFRVGRGCTQAVSAARGWKLTFLGRSDCRARAASPASPHFVIIPGVGVT